MSDNKSGGQCSKCAVSICHDCDYHVCDCFDGILPKCKCDDAKNKDEEIKDILDVVGD